MLFFLCCVFVFYSTVCVDVVVEFVVCCFFSPPTFHFIRLISDDVCVSMECNGNEI